MPEARLELAQGFNSPTDFKSGASADSATRAFYFLMRMIAIRLVRMEARGGIEPPISVLQTDALPLCYRAKNFVTR